MPDNILKLPTEILNELLPKPKEVEITTEQFISDQLGIDMSLYAPKDKERIIRNYICLISIVRKEIEKLSVEIARLKLLLKETPKGEDYKRKRIEYFIKISYEARDEILDFLNKELPPEATANRDLINRLSTEEKKDLLFHILRYDYAFFTDYYDYNYDFSTDVKFRFLPNQSLIDTLPRIKKYIKLNSTAPAEFEAEKYHIVDSTNMMSQISERVKLDYYLCKRQDIYVSLNQLFIEQKYLPFIALATLQLEGMFYDLCLIKYGEKGNMGTLVEKVEKALRSNPRLFQPLYPYFAFDVPELRNEIAHTGLLQGRDLKSVAYGLVLDMNCILKCVENESKSKFIVFMTMREELIRSGKQDDPEALASELLYELCKTVPLAGEYFWDVLKSPDSYVDEMNFYIPAEKELNKEYLPEIVNYIVAMVKSEIFWSVVLSQVKQTPANVTRSPFDFINLVYKLRNEMIPLLNSPAKEVCIEVSKELKRFGF